jgi:hypothetical protein
MENVNEKVLNEISLADSMREYGFVTNTPVLRRALLISVRHSLLHALQY